jgi:hypothetical protein
MKLVRNPASIYDPSLTGDIKIRLIVVLNRSSAISFDDNTDTKSINIVKKPNTVDENRPFAFSSVSEIAFSASLLL